MKVTKILVSQPKPLTGKSPYYDIAEKYGVDNVFDNAKAVKTFENGQLVIIKNGVKYNALGAQL